MTDTEMIIYGILSSILFASLCYAMDWTANYFYCDAEVEWDIIAIRMPALVCVIIAGAMILKGNIFFALSFVLGILIIEIFIGTDSTNQVQQNGPTQ